MLSKLFKWIGIFVVVVFAMAWCAANKKPDSSPATDTIAKPMTASEAEAEAQRKEREAAAYKAAAAQGAKDNERIAKEQEKARAARAAERKKYPAECRDVSDEAFESIKNKQVYIGMSEVEARCAWGKPERINNTINARGKRSQWVYSGHHSYLYFQDGVLETVQN